MVKKVVKNEKKKEVKRIDWIDTLRGLAMYFVVWGHAQKNKTRIRSYIYSFHMPLFFFISGLTFGESDKMPFKDFLKRKIKGLIVPYITLNVICYILRAILFHLNVLTHFEYLDFFVGTFYSNNSILPIPCGASWFIVSLFLVNIMFYFFKKYSKNDFELGIVCAICGIISYVNSLSPYQLRGPWHIEAVFTGIVFFYLGYLFIKNIKKFDFLFNDKLRMLFYGFLLGLVGLLGASINRRVSMDGNLYGSIFLFYFNSLCTTAGLVCFVKLILPKSILFKDVGKKALFFLGYHQILISVLVHFYPILFSNSLFMFIHGVIMMVLLHILSIPVYRFFPWMIGKFKFLSKI